MLILYKHLLTHTHTQTMATKSLSVVGSSFPSALLHSWHRFYSLLCVSLDIVFHVDGGLKQSQRILANN